MNSTVSRFWISLAVGLLGLAVGASYLTRALSESATSRDLVLGLVCTVLAAGWLIGVVRRRRAA